MQLEAHALKLMAACFKDLKDEENFLRNFFASLNNNPKERYCWKVNLVMNWERGKKISSQ